MKKEEKSRDYESERERGGVGGREINLRTVCLRLNSSPGWESNPIAYKAGQLGWQFWSHKTLGIVY
jgi:hypothetical protein